MAIMQSGCTKASLILALASASPSKLRIKKNTDDYASMNAAQEKLEIGNRLRMAIEALNLRQVDVCRQIGISPSKLNNYLRGENIPSFVFIKAFCLRYNITTDWIYLGRVSALSKALGDALWAASEAPSPASQVEADRPCETE